MGEFKRVRPVYFKKLGDYLVKLREAQKWTQSDAASQAHRRNLTPITRQIILRMERGQVKDPKPHVLRQLATLYKRDSSDVLWVFLAEKYGLDLPRQAAVVNSASQQAETGDRHAEDRRYEQLRQQYHALLDEFDAISTAFFDAIARGRNEFEEDHPLPAAHPADRTGKADSGL